MATFLKVTGAMFCIFIILSLLPTFYVNIEGFEHWVSVSGFTENLIGFAVVVLVFFALAVAFISVFAGLFVVIAMIIGGIVLAGLSVVWPFLLLGFIGYLLFSRSKKSN